MKWLVVFSLAFLGAFLGSVTAVAHLSNAEVD